jgi:CMP-N-acetylneuraminic acid synthetase
MPKLDKTYSTSGNIYIQKNDAHYYKDFSLEKIGEIFAYLNSVSYNYDILNPPKMDKTLFSSRKN